MLKSKIASQLPRVENAVEYLLFGRGPLRRRLAEAYRDYLSPIPTWEYPTDELRKLAESIQAAMTAYTLGPALDAEHGRIKAAMHLMPGSRALSVARLVFGLYTGLVHQALEAEQREPRNGRPEQPPDR